ncbi:MAG: DNA polymerase III subunit alpha [Fervidobacterium sp.]
MQKIRKILFFVSPYSFEGSIINFDDLFSFILENKIDGVVISDSTFHGVIKFLSVAQSYKDVVDSYIGYRINNVVFVFTNTEEFYKFLTFYNSKPIDKSTTDILKKQFTYFEVTPLYYLPKQKHVYELFCDYIQQNLRVHNGLSDCLVEASLSSPNYILRSYQNLPKPSSDFLGELLNKETEYKDRLEKEIKLIKSFRFEDYFYTIKRIIEIAKSNDVEIGPGRGSAVGSLVAYRLGITKIDPVKYGLLFERFLNEGRSDYPDIDLDTEDVKRQKLINLLREEFGYVYNISTFSSVPKKFLENLPDDAKKILSRIPLQRSTHASGLVISTNPVFVPIVPLTETLEWDMDDLQSIDCVKFDVLGLKTLSIYKELKNSINTKSNNESIKKTYKYICVGFTDNVFQLESSIGKSVVRDVRPSNIRELAIAISLNRPGPLRSGITNEIRSLKLKKKRKYELDILQETYGLPIYQEQIMLIAMNLAGLTSRQADALRKAIAKKDSSDFAELITIVKNALTEKLGKDGEELSKSLILFGEYAFNKSHAIAYAHLTYYMAFFKVNYPKLFYDVYLKHDSSILCEAIYNLQALGYKVLPPKIDSLSSKDRNDEKVYRLPLYVLPGISYEKSLQLQNTNFEDFEDFVEKADLSLSTIEALVKIGTFDELFDSRRKAIQKLRTLRSGFNPEVARIGGKIFGKIIKLDETKVEDDWERTNMEYEVLKVPISLPTKTQNHLAPYCVAYALNLPYGVHVSVKAGFATDGKSVFKTQMPDGDYTLIYPDKFEIGHLNISYQLKHMPTRSEISKTSSSLGVEEIILPNGRLIKNARPIQNDFKTFVKK